MQEELFNEKDWTGNSKAVFSTLGSSNHSEVEREKYDFYATDPKALELLLKLEKFENVWECACGQGHLSEILRKNNIHGKSSDYIDRGYKWGGGGAGLLINRCNRMERRYNNKSSFYLRN